MGMGMRMGNGNEGGVKERCGVDGNGGGPASGVGMEEKVLGRRRRKENRTENRELFRRVGSGWALGIWSNKVATSKPKCNASNNIYPKLLL